MLEDDLKELWKTDYLGDWQAVEHEYAVWQYYEKRINDPSLISDTETFRNVLLEVTTDSSTQLYPSRAATLCIKTARLIQERLLEALSSPDEYIRTWAMFITGQIKCTKIYNDGAVILRREV